MAEVATEGSPEKKRSTKERGIDDYKRKIWKLKKELEEQRELSLAVQKEELEKLAQEMLLDKEKAVEALKLETRNDLLQMKAAVTHKETELRAIIKRQEDEMKVYKKQSAAHAEEVKGVQEAIESAHQDTVSKLQRELKQLKHMHQELQQKYQIKQQDYKDKVGELRCVQEEAEAERQKLLSDALTAKLSRVKRDQDSMGVGSKDSRDLQHKVTELTVALKRLEKRCDSLKEENTNLRKTEAGYKEIEEQCAKLKRRNVDLTNNVKSAGEKNKQLQVNKKSADSMDATPGVDHAKKLFARQRAKDFAEHAKALVNKDKEIEKLTKKNVMLSETMSNEARHLIVRQQVDMNTALRQGTKERMSLEMRSTGPGGDDSECRAAMFNMQVDLDSLRDKYDSALCDKLKLEEELEEFRNRLGEIEQELGIAHKERTALKVRCDTKDEKFVQLTASYNTLVKEREHLTDTVDKLTEELAVFRREKKDSLRAIDKLQESNRELRVLLETKDESELQHFESNILSLTEELQDTKSQLKGSTLHISQLEAEVSAFKCRVHELLEENQQVKNDLKAVNHSVLPTLEKQTEQLQAAKKQLELKNEDLKEEKQEWLLLSDINEDLLSQLETAKLSNLSLTEKLDEADELLQKERKKLTAVQNESSMKLEELSTQLQHTNDERAELENNRVEAQRRIEVLKHDFKSVLITKESEIEEISQKNADLEATLSDYRYQLSQANTKLADAEQEVSVLQADLSSELNTHTTELESLDILNQKLNSTVAQLEHAEESKNELGVELNKLKLEKQDADGLLMCKTSLELKVVEVEEHLQHKSDKLEELILALQTRDLELKTSTSNTQTMQEAVSLLKGEKENFLAEQARLSKLIVQRETEKRALSSQVSKLACDLELLQSSHLETTNVVNTKRTECDTTKRLLEELQIRHAELESNLEKSKQFLSESRKQETLAKKKLITLKHDLTSSYEKKLTSLSETLETSFQTNKELECRLSSVTAQMEEQSMEQISVYAGDNCYHLYVARHVYDPATSNGSHSPVKSGDRSGADSALSTSERIADISVNPGDYVFVSGGLSEEGFYEGHLLDGRAGLIPSNVLEPLYEFDIYGFVVASEPLLNDANTSEAVVSEFNSTMFNESNWLPSTPHPSTPYPLNLILDRQLANGILVGWDCPEGQETVFLYRVYVDEKFRASLNGRSKCKALIEGVKSSQPHRISVTATTSLGESDSRHCTIVIGEPDRPPSQLNVIAVNAETARISFLPHNSNHHHLVLVNGDTVRTLAPSLYQVDIGGLLHLTEYCITVAACHLPLDRSFTHKHSDNMSVSIQFTMPSADHHQEISDSQLEAGFLQKFDKFLDVVTNQSSPPAISDLQQIEPELEDADFLKSYDAGLTNTHPNSNSSNIMMHSTPKYITNLNSKKPHMQEFSPIILDLEEGDEGKYNTITSQLNADSTPVVGDNELLSMNGSQCNKETAGKRGMEASRNGKVSSGQKSRSSPLQNKHSLQKMIKSLANKDKSRPTKSQVKVETSHRHTSADKRIKPVKDTAKGMSNCNVAAPQSEQMSHVRALYDYVPAVMSPNKDAVTEELSFQAGDIIAVYGDVDSDGFYLGEMKGQKGFVPSNLVDEINESLSPGNRRMKALFDYDPSALSPNKDSQKELSFLAGDTVVVRGDMDEDGFYKGFVAGKSDRQGLIPSNYLRDLPNS